MAGCAIWPASAMRCTPDELVSETLPFTGPTVLPASVSVSVHVAPAANVAGQSWVSVKGDVAVMLVIAAGAEPVFLTAAVATGPGRPRVNVPTSSDARSESWTTAAPIPATAAAGVAV